MEANYYSDNTCEKINSLVDKLKKSGIDYQAPKLLIDQKLYGVNPFNKNLSLSTKERILQECRCNIWYLIRMICNMDEDDIILDLSIDDIIKIHLLTQGFSITTKTLDLIDIIWHIHTTQICSISVVNDSTIVLNYLRKILPDYIPINTNIPLNDVSTPSLDCVRYNINSNGISTILSNVKSNIPHIPARILLMNNSETNSRYADNGRFDY